MGSNIAYERASFARDAEYISSMVQESAVDDALLSVDCKVNGCPEEPSDEEIDEVIRQIPANDEARNEEIERIVNSHKDLDIDGVMGLGNSYEEELDDEEELV